MDEIIYGVACHIEKGLIDAKVIAENLCKIARICTFEPQKYQKAVWVIALKIFEVTKKDAVTPEIQDKMIAALKSAQNILRPPRNPRENPESYMFTLCSIAVTLYDYVEAVKD